MIFYKYDYAIEKTLNLRPSLEQKFLLELQAKNFRRKKPKNSLVKGY